MAASKPEIQQWLWGRYLEHTGAGSLKGSPQYQRFVADVSREDLSGGFAKAVKFIHLRYGYPISADGYTVAVLSAKWLKTEPKHRRTAYAHVYWRVGKEQAPPEYVCLGYTYSSRDGEYRAP